MDMRGIRCMYASLTPVSPVSQFLLRVILRKNLYWDFFRFQPDGFPVFPYNNRIAGLFMFLESFAYTLYKGLSNYFRVRKRFFNLVLIFIFIFHSAQQYYAR